jgi:hypothetical protein
MSWRRFLRRGYWDAERLREIDSYLETETADNLARGMMPAEAASEARRKFGNLTLIREEIYRMKYRFLAGEHRAGCALWRSSTADKPGLRGRGHRVAGFGHWR